MAEKALEDIKKFIRKNVAASIKRFIRQNVSADIQKFTRQNIAADIKKLILGILITIFLVTIIFSNSYFVAAYGSSDPRTAAALFIKSNDIKIIWLFTLSSILFMGASVASEYIHSVKTYGKIYFITSIIFLTFALLLASIAIIGTLNPQDITDDLFYSISYPLVWYTASIIFIAVGSISFGVSIYLAYKEIQS